MGGQNLNAELGHFSLKRNHQKMSTFKNKFSWSISRDRDIPDLPQAILFQLLRILGRLANLNAPERTRQIYILKQLKNRHMWAGAKVHDCIERTLTNLQRGISVLDVDQIVDITLNQMREEFRSSREKRYHTHPKTCALFEHEYEMRPYQIRCGKRRPIIWNNA